MFRKNDQPKQSSFFDSDFVLPEPLKRLFAVTHLKLTSQALGVLKVDLGPERGKLEFGNHTSVDPIKIVNLVQREASTYTLEGASTLRIKHTLPEFTDRVAFAEDLLQRLAPQVTAAA